MISNLVRRDLRDPFSLVRSDGMFGDLMDRFFSAAFEPLGGTGVKPFPVDLHETDEQYVLKADMPGATAENLDVSYEDGTLTVSCLSETQDERKDENTRCHIRERSVGSYSRSFRLPNINPDSIGAQLVEGVLTIRANKAEDSKIKRIQIETKK